uniref:Leucine-rich repeat-containing N-terminal plant-type domain-containing protein n=1 Tax=Salix viminalis TaxID=40686 RepID=A0A6N2LVY6_SALVM
MLLVLKTQNLQGSLPPDFSRFPYLQVIDFSQNYLNGSIPPEWGATQMTTMYYFGGCNVLSEISMQHSRV